MFNCSILHYFSSLGTVYLGRHILFIDSIPVGSMEVVFSASSVGWVTSSLVIAIIEAASFWLRIVPLKVSGLAAIIALLLLLSIIGRCPYVSLTINYSIRHYLLCSLSGVKLLS